MGLLSFSLFFFGSLREPFLKLIGALKEAGDGFHGDDGSGPGPSVSFLLLSSFLSFSFFLPLVRLFDGPGLELRNHGDTDVKPPPRSDSVEV